MHPARGPSIQDSSTCSPAVKTYKLRHKNKKKLLTVSAIIFLYSSTVVLSWAFWININSLSIDGGDADDDNVELVSPLSALVLLFFSTSWKLLLLLLLLVELFLFRWLADGEVLLLWFDWLLLTSCVLRFSNTLFNHVVSSSDDATVNDV